jgi:polyhydroxyalkanoate synthesis regulator phasin
MAQIDVFKRYLDAGMAFTELTEKKARSIVKDLVKTGEVQTKDAGRRVEELLDRSRKNTEGLRAIVQGEVQNQIKKLGLVPKKELDAVKKELADLKAKQSKAPSAAPKPAAKKASPVKKTVKKAAAKKATTAPTPSPASGSTSPASE